MSIKQYHIVKSLVYIAGTIAVAVCTFLFPKYAWASDSGDWGWDTDSFMNETHMGETTSITEGGKSLVVSISEAVGSATTMIAGIAIAIFVWRVVVTGIDRGVARGGNNNEAAKGFSFTEIPYIGAYSVEKMPRWSDIWLMFVKQMIIIIAAWGIVNLLLALIVFFSGQMAGGNANAAAGLS